MAGSFVRNFWRESKEIDIKVFECEGEPFDLMALTDDQYKDVQHCATSKEMLNLASNIGQMFERERISSNHNMSQDFERFWCDLDSKLEYNDTPSMREQVGVKVCEISGLLGVLEGKRKAEAEENSRIVDGDPVTQEQLAADIEHHQQHVA